MLVAGAKSGTDNEPRILSAETREWLGTSKDEAQKSLRSFLSDVLLSRNLIVLCGLGTSLCIRDRRGKRVAPTMQDLWQDATKDPDFATVRETVRFPSDDENIERLLSQCHLSLAWAADQNVTGFVKRTEELIVRRCSFAKPTMAFDLHGLFLRKAARRSTRLPRMKLFTTNYDLVFEAAAASTGFIAVDGFSHTWPPLFDGANFDYDFVRRDDEREGPEYIPNVFHLYKIHGSVDWVQDGERILRNGDSKTPLIIYPRNSKFESSYSPPFLEMMSRLQVALRAPNTGVLVVGFGFNDDHIAQPLISALRANVGLKALVVAPGLGPESNTNRHLNVITELVLAGDERLALFRATFENLVEWMPDLVATTDEELHRQRLRGDRRK